MFGRLFLFLLVGHCMVDWWFQSSRVAKEKVNNLKVLVEHCMMYAIITALCGFYVTDSLGVFIFILLFNFGLHVLLDMRDFTLWWLKTFKIKSEKWLIFVIDQTFHIVSLIILTEIVYRGVW